MLRRYPPVGSRPGEFSLEPGCVESQITLISYSHNSFEEVTFSGDDLLDDTHGFVGLIKKHITSTSVIWLDISGIGKPEVLHTIAELFNLHELTIGDLGNVPQRPKIEEQEEYLLIISTMLYLMEEYALEREQLSIVLGKKFVLTFQERPGDVLEPVRKRIRSAQNMMRKVGSDYLAYAILDTVIDSYFPIVERVGESLEDIENQIISNSDTNVLPQIYSMKRQLLTIRRTIWPHREIFNSILRSDMPLIKKTTKTYFRDSYDHTIELMDVVEMGREMAGSFTDIYLSTVSNRLNDVMKVLTIISTVFIPLSFVASVYGMNFEHMPELHHPWAYPAVLSFMFLAASGMLFLFWRKGWLGRRPKNEAGT
jgi:magnesium transporter